MQLEVQNRTLGLVIATAELMFPTSVMIIMRIIKYFRAFRRGFEALCELFPWMIKILYRTYFPDGSEPNDLYTNVWSQRDCDADLIKAANATIRPFKIHVADKVLSDLKLRLERTRLEDSLVNSDQELNSECLRKLTDYWKNQYQWRKHEEELNKYPQFVTNIKGLDIHFVHIKYNQEKGNKVSSVNLLLIPEINHNNI
ncbi:juvenile hormone epoxide hydrolase 1 [Trichonephila inaurata madagascariensis]|uniref:Juvenile hormone epoxide hydrolase 1 n=2 Tax=Trichonephila inaurata madagascariensis TaxID=2747483 RepID=A0A8X6YJ90_9ARAC|nr:juvenile hormone epoxide hydrolase 1 [Trichonephila inaurata madagascariensis]